MKTTIALGALLLAWGSAWAVAPPPRPDLTALVQQLDDEDFDVRQQADQALRQQSKTVVPQLRQFLEHAASLEVRARLERIIEALTLDERLPELMLLLGDRQECYRELADWELRRCGDLAIPLLEQQLRRTTLSLEQRNRLERIVSDLRPRGR